MFDSEKEKNKHIPLKEQPYVLSLFWFHVNRQGQFYGSKH